MLEAGSGADGSGEASSGEMLDTGVLEAGSGADGSGEASSGEAVSVGGGRMDVVYDTTPNHKAFSARITLDADHPLHANIVDGSWLYATLSCTNKLGESNSGRDYHAAQVDTEPPLPAPSRSRT